MNEFETLKPDERTERLKRVVRNLVEEMNLAIALREMHGTGAYENAVPNAFNNTFEAWGYNVVTNSLHSEFVIVLMRIHDKAGLDTSSLATAFTLLDDDDVVTGLKDEWRRWYEEMFGGKAIVIEPDSVVSGAKEQADFLGQRIVAVRGEYSALKGYHLIPKLKKFRNKVIAHLHASANKDQTHTGAKPAQWGDAGALLDKTIPVIAALSSTILFHDCGHTDLVEAWKCRAQNFWWHCARLSTDNAPTDV